MSLHEDVRVERLDQLVASGSAGLSLRTEIDILKIDVEGYELFVLRELGDLIAKVKFIQF